MQEVLLYQVPKLAVNQCISVVAEVVTVGEAASVTSKTRDKPLIKQECMIRDSKGSCRIVLWQEDIGKLSEGESYRLSNVLVRQYSGIKYQPGFFEGGFVMVGVLARPEIFCCDHAHFPRNYAPYKCPIQLHARHAHGGGASRSLQTCTYD